MKRYEYRVLPFTAVVSLATTPEPDAFISDDAESREYARLLKEGFRWVRTDLDTFAVFEKEVTVTVP